MTVLGIVGLKGSGKGVVAARLVTKHNFKVVKFADPLKDMLRVLGLNDYDLEGEGKEKANGLVCGRTPRHAMQTLGTEWGRNHIGDEIWIEAWLRRAVAVQENVVADDVRFGNEAAAIKAANGLLVKVVPQDNNFPTQNHPSETEVNSIFTDFVIMNDRVNLNELHKRTDEVMDLIHGKPQD
jgi:predicted kinase